MNETVLWLLYVVSGAAAFALVHKLRWRIVPSMLVGTAIAMIGWGILYQLTSDELKPVFWKLDMWLNTSFGLIFAGVGAALAMALPHIRKL